MNSSSRAVLNVFVALLLGAGIFYAGIAFASARYQYTPLGMMNGGPMMGGYSYGARGNSEAVSAEQARTAIESYISSLGNPDLTIKEIMIFDNGAYAIVEEQSSGIGAFELLVDPVSLFVFPEYGSNMMWNLKYGMMSGSGGYGMMGGGRMMGGGYGGAQSSDASADMPLSSEEARHVAQKYLDAFLPGAAVTDEVSAFYGYYTIDIEKEGRIVGMLSVNGFSKQVFLHTWHGNFIEMSEE